MIKPAHSCHSGENWNPVFLCNCDESTPVDEEAIHLFKQATVNCFFLHCFSEVVISTTNQLIKKHHEHSLMRPGYD
jgi:hypothetical protein